MIRINKDRKPLEDAEVERILATIGVKAAAKKKGFLSKLIG